MSATALVAAALLGQSAFSLIVTAPETNRTDVAYQELASNRTADAIAKLEAMPAAQASDPARLINLGAAYARMGRTDQALRAYRAAIASEDRTDLQLADGTWGDSRDLARKAMAGLTAGTLQASRR